MHLRKKLDTIEALSGAIQGYEHLPVEVLYQFLLENYTIDLDVLAEFTDQLDQLSGNVADSGMNTSRSSQSAA